MVRFTKWTTNYSQVLATTQTKNACLVFNKKATGKIHAFVGGNGSLYIAQNRDTFTYTGAMSYLERAFDHDLGSYANYQKTGVISETNILTVDYGSVAVRILYLKVGADANTKLRIYLSSDGANWVNLLTITNTDQYELITITSLRYLKVTYENLTPGTVGVSKVYEIWAVSTANCYSITSTWESGVQRLSVGLPVYFVFVFPTESINPTATCAIYEENVPTSVQEVGVE